MAFAITEQKLFLFEKTAYKWSLIIMAAAVYSLIGLPLGNANAAIDILKGYITENTIQKKNIDTLALAKDKWMKDIKAKYGGYKINTLKEGIIYVGMVKNINSRKIKINSLEINKNVNPDIEIIPVQLKAHSRTSINKFINNPNIIAAVNGTYFKPNTGTALGTLVIDKEIISGPIYERAALGIGKNVYKTARVGFFGTLENETERLRINNINQPRMISSDVLIYTKAWGEKSPSGIKRMKHISVYNDKIIAESDFPLIIPENGYVISAPKEKFKNFELGSKVKVDYLLYPEWKDIDHIISGGPFLIRNGEIYIDTKSEKLTAIEGKNPRTAVGYTKDNVLIMVTIDGRKEGSSGVTLSELAKIMYELGCYEAINLDGGSSTVMYAAGNIYKGTDSKNPPFISNALVVKV